MREFILLLMGAGFLAACGAEAPAADNPADSPLAVTTLLSSAVDVEGALETIVQEVRFAPGAEIPRHYHPGEEYIVVLEGEVTLLEDGAAPRVMRSGEAYKIVAGMVHAAKNGPEPARAIAFRVHQAGEPERIAAE